MNHNHAQNRESNMHYYAKHIFSEWLEKKWHAARDNGQTKAHLGVLEWGIDCRYGSAVYQEYPLLKTDNGDVLGLIDWKGTYPDLSHDNLEKLNLTLESVLDVAVCENGRLKYGIEIVYKHLCTEKKRKFLRSISQMKVYEVSAEWVLSQLHGKLPTIIPLTHI